MRVSNEIRIFEIKGEVLEPETDITLRIESHDHKKGLVVLKYDGMVVAVPAKDLRVAVENATRTEE